MCPPTYLDNVLKELNEFYKYLFFAFKSRIKTILKGTIRGNYQIFSTHLDVLLQNIQSTIYLLYHFVLLLLKPDDSEIFVKEETQISFLMEEHPAVGDQPNSSLVKHTKPFNNQDML